MTNQEKIEAIKALIDLLKSDNVGMPYVTNGELRNAIEAKLYSLIESL